MQRVKTSITTARYTLLMQADRGDFAHPDLVGTHNLQLFDQVGRASKPMRTVGRSMLARRDLAHDAQLTHETLDVFAVDREAPALQLSVSSLDMSYPPCS